MLIFDEVTPLDLPEDQRKELLRKAEERLKEGKFITLSTEEKAKEEEQIVALKDVKICNDKIYICKSKEKQKDENNK